MMKRNITFTVEGRSHFPVDMLRYDSCWPASTDDALNMLETNQRKVRLVSGEKPTPARWESFGWFVTNTRPA